MNLNWNVLLPLVFKWAGSQEQEILASGKALSNDLNEFAGKIGIQHPEKVRILPVHKVPTPLHPVLEKACLAIGLVPKNIAGMALGYGIYIREDCIAETRIYKHELAHVLQYEQLGGIKPFLNKYIHEVLTKGYPHAPMELEAKDKESL